MKKPKLIITGSKGTIGKVLCLVLTEKYDVYKIDLKKDKSSNYFQADISDFESLKSIFQKIGKVPFLIHLAADSKVDARWDSVLKNNIIGTKNVYECSRLWGIERIVFASSNHTTGGYEGIPSKLHEQETTNLITIQDPIKPDGDYGSSKVFGEALARQYFELFGLQSICLRIGSVLTDNNPMKDPTKRLLKTWLSHRDLIQLVEKSLSAEVPFGIYYGVSNNTGRFWDISNAEKELGYQPIDNALNPQHL